MDNLPLVSIITGYYNRIENLQESITSILNQSYPNFEYIIFDDCSTDGTYELLKEFDDPRLKLFRTEVNVGFTKGIISAISRSNGDLIAIHGAGDISYKERIAKQVTFLMNNPEIGIVGCLVEDVSKDGTVIHSPVSIGLKDNFTQGEVIYRRTLYERVGGYNSIFKYGQFTILKKEMLKISLPGYVDEILYKRIHFADGVTKNKSKIIEQQIYINMGKSIAKNDNIFNLDMTGIVVGVCLNNITLLNIGSTQEQFFLFHLKKRSLIIGWLYNLYKMNFISAVLFKRISLKIFRL